MKKIDWIRKLTSRKFWAAVVGFVTQLMIAFGVADSTIAQTSAVIMAGATLIAYMIAEGLVDGDREAGRINFGDDEIIVPVDEEGAKDD